MTKIFWTLGTIIRCKNNYKRWEQYKAVWQAYHNTSQGIELFEPVNMLACIHPSVERNRNVEFPIQKYKVMTCLSDRHAL